VFHRRQQIGSERIISDERFAPSFGWFGSRQAEGLRLAASF